MKIMRNHEIIIRLSGCEIHIYISLSNAEKPNMIVFR